MSNRIISSIAISLPVLVCSMFAQATIIEDFDGGGTTPYTLTNSSGAAPSIMAGGPSGSFLRLTNLSPSNYNSIAFDEEASQTGGSMSSLELSFDFRMTDDAANAMAGGCCGSAADGMGIGFFNTSTYGVAGGNNPSGIWERPSYADAFTVGLDIFRNIDVVNLNWGGIQVAEIEVGGFLDLNNNLFNRAVVSITNNGANATVNMDIIEDVFGASIAHNIFTNQAIAGLDLGNFPNYRLIAGGRTGGAYTAGDLDNISVSSIPEPSLIALFGLGLAGLGFSRRKKA